MMVSIETQDVDLDRVGKKLQKALALTLTDSAKYANADLIKTLTAKIDRPAPFTLRPSGYGVTVARFGASGSDLFSESYIKPAQSAYLRFVIEGGTRGLGDAGASAKHVFVPGQRVGFDLPGDYSERARRSAYGGVPNSYSENLYDKWKAGKGMPSSAGGVFFNDGRIKHLPIGFIARPKRTARAAGSKLTAAQKRNQESFRTGRRDVHGRFVASGLADVGQGRRKGDADLRVQNKGVPMVLLAEAHKGGRNATHHHRLIDYAGIMSAAHERSVAEFAARFERLK